MRRLLAALRRRPAITAIGALALTIALAGAAFLPLCDVLARNTMWWIRGDGRQVPVGVLTNLLGGAFFLFLLLRRKDAGAGL